MKNNVRQHLQTAIFILCPNLGRCPQAVAI